MRILFLGDIVGKSGLQLIKSALVGIRTAQSIDVVIANAENVSGGSGCLPSAYRQLREAGVDMITLGDHVYKKSEIISVLESDERICRPANFPASSPGRTFARMTTASGIGVAVTCVLGRTFMRPANCPFEALDAALREIGTNASVIFVDAHAEATADKYLLGHHLDGRVTAVLGTHTHVPTADEQILPNGTAFQCDVGMCGPHRSVLGRRVDRVLHHARTFLPTPFDVAEGDDRLNGAIVECEPATGRASFITRFRFPD